MNSNDELTDLIATVYEKVGGLAALVVYDEVLAAIVDAVVAVAVLMDVAARVTGQHAWQRVLTHRQAAFPPLDLAALTRSEAV